MASPGKKPRLEAAASTSANPQLVILNKDKPARMYSRLMSRPKILLPKQVLDSDSSGTTTNNEMGPIILVWKLSAVDTNLIYQSAQLGFHVTCVRDYNFSDHRRRKCTGSDSLRLPSTCSKAVSSSDLLGFASTC
jgi:hypothetical protein